MVRKPIRSLMKSGTGMCWAGTAHWSVPWMLFWQKTAASAAKKLNALHRRFNTTHQVADQSAKTGDQLASEIDDVCNMIELAIGSARDYGHSLQDITTDLNDETNRDQLRRMVSVLAETTRKSIDETRTLEANLRESRNDMNALRETLQAVRTESLTDALTGVANRRRFDDVFLTAIANAPKTMAPISLMMVDIDRFKLFNDTHGHRAGDQVLRLVAMTIRQHLPKDATAARYGGEEFAVILPGYRTTHARQLADKIRRMLSAKDLVKVSSGTSLGRISASIGIAQLAPDDTPASLIERADRCLYTAKRAGRDRTVCEEEMIPPQAARIAS